MDAQSTTIKFTSGFTHIITVKLEGNVYVANRQVIQPDGTPAPNGGDPRYTSDPAKAQEFYEAFVADSRSKAVIGGAV
jgi:hypothetical protein